MSVLVLIKVSDENSQNFQKTCSLDMFKKSQKLSKQKVKTKV